jgi:hypothetical protein
MLPPA